MITASGKIYLRYFCTGDEEPIFQYTGDLESCKYLARKPHKSQMQTKNMLCGYSTSTSLEKLGKCIWIIADASNRKALGYLTLVESGEALELHIGIINKFRGKGIASSALNLASCYLANEFGYKQIISFTDKEHSEGKAAFKKAGFRVIDERKQYYIAPQLSASKRDVYLLRWDA